MDTPTTVTLILGEAPPARLDKALAEIAPEDSGLSRSKLMKLIESGDVSLDGVVARSPKEKAVAGGEYMVLVPPVIDFDNAKGEDIPLDIVFEDEALIVVNKPAGMVVHPAPGSETGTLVNALIHHCGADLSKTGGMGRPGIVHRIDKDTSGLLVVAKTELAHQGLAKQFHDHSIARRYLAICFGAPSKADPRLAGLRGVGFEPGGVLRIATNIARHKGDRKRMAVTAHEGRHAITRARALKPLGREASLMECWLETGRTHQIRVHFSHIGHALIGDPIYGLRRQLSGNGLDEQDAEYVKTFGRQALHATSLGFIHPISGEEIAFEAELPSDIQKLAVLLEKATKRES